MSSVHNTANKFDKWCRLVILIEEGGLTVCKDILHKRMHVPTEGQGIYKCLQHYRMEIEKYKLHAYQEKILLPDDAVIDKKQLNLHLYTYIIQVLDKAKQYSSIKRLRYKRNKLFHMEEGRRDMCEEEFEEYWDQVSQMLKSLGYDMILLNSLKSEALFLTQEREEMLKNIFCDIQGTT